MSRTYLVSILLNKNILFLYLIGVSEMCFFLKAIIRKLDIENLLRGLALDITSSSLVMVDGFHSD